jgi:6-phosphogluconolactonase/glucosamine-6-phosphate isomerase/deaminase
MGQEASEATGASTAAGCAELKAQIDSMQSEFERVWLAISTGSGDKSRYHQLRQELQDLRIRFRRECGDLTETSNLPRSVTADWRAG